MENKKTLFIDGREYPINGERNLLEVIRKAGIDIPTFCYHSELSVYGACRLCIVEIEGRGIVGSCSTPAEPGMKVHTNTPEIREMRKITIELLLANHEQNCLTCIKSTNCQLQELASRLGVDSVRFKSAHVHKPVDRSSPSIIRDPNKCVLCGDCVRMCHEVQGVGAIDFTHRGSNVMVLPAFGKDLSEVECVNCGQCARVCPTGALTVATQIESVWKELHNPEKTVVVQIAPAVRVALGDSFGMQPGEVVTGKIITALKRLGFDKVYDTSFTADLTVVEEANEFLERKINGKNLPQFTSCCPAWVKFAEQYYSELLPNISTCRSPQQMFGSVAKKMLPDLLNINRENLVVVSIMPCTAKKFEALRPEFNVDGYPDVDFVLSTKELGKMIKEAGLNFTELEPESFDLPLGFKTGAGVIFGVTGGVSEAVLRFAVEKLSGEKLENVDFVEVRNNKGIKEATFTVAGTTVKLAIVHSLSNARKVADQVIKGECDYDLIEVMACPGGCVGGAGQPTTRADDIKPSRAQSLFNIDKNLQLHKSQDNPYIGDLYEKILTDHKIAHELLHTEYNNRKRIQDNGMSFSGGNGDGKLHVDVCLGTGCYLKGAQDLLREIITSVGDMNLTDLVDVRGSFCFEHCSKGPTVRVGKHLIEKCNIKLVLNEIQKQLNSKETVSA
ncbi:MAG: NADH-dependent [FeFe] hydrogenase, group A6 [Fibrobacter sp.]|nr:NADH-dependent [FeFe] hydrogenase, group A6 [Fibrobacter sp.]